MDVNGAPGGAHPHWPGAERDARHGADRQGPEPSRRTSSTCLRLHLLLSLGDGIRRAAARSREGFYTFPDSAHSPVVEQPQRARELLVQDVLAGTTGHADPPDHKPPSRDLNSPSVDDEPAGEVDLAGGDGSGPVRCQEGGHVGDRSAGTRHRRRSTRRPGCASRSGAGRRRAGPPRPPWCPSRVRVGPTGRTQERPCQPRPERRLGSRRRRHGDSRRSQRRRAGSGPVRNGEGGDRAGPVVRRTQCGHAVQHPITFVHRAYSPLRLWPSSEQQ